MPSALIPLANGVEEMEAVIVIDVLRRAHWNVVSAGLAPGVITASRGVRLLPDAEWAAIQPGSFDLLVLPGGAEGTAALARDGRVLDTVRDFARDGRKWLAAVCAAPLVLQAAGILGGRRVTCHPGVADQLTQTARLDECVVVDGRLITSQGPGTSFEFALALVSALEGAGKADELATALGVKA